MEVAGFSLVDVAVTLVTREDKLLLIFNREWGAFTLPMTKRRAWVDAENPRTLHQEPWAATAVRNLAEVLGRTIVQPPAVVLEIGDWRQSDRDGSVKRYHFQVFQAAVAGRDDLASGLIAEWLSPDEILDESRQPISPTARFLVRELKAAGVVS